MPFISKAQELRKLNVGLHSRMCALVQKAEEEKRALTAEENQEWDRMDKEYGARSEEIVKNEKLEERERETAEAEKREREKAALDTRRAGRELPTGQQQETEKKALAEAFDAYLRQPASAWDEETRLLIQKQQTILPAEVRALGLGAGVGGELIPEDFMAELEKAMLSFSGILQAARVVPTGTGADLPWPTVNDTTNKGRLLAEGAAAADLDPTFAAVTLQAFVYTSDWVKIANTLLQDSAFPLESEVALMLGERLGRILNEHATIGDGTAKPRGVVTAVAADTTPVVKPTGELGTVKYDDLVDLQHAVDPAYRARNPVWMFHDTVLKIIKKLIDADGRPLWASGVAVREPDTILGSRFFINQDMDSTLAANTSTALYGDFSKYIIRRVLSPTLVVARELFVGNFQTGILMVSRWDSDLVDAGTGPIKVLNQAAT